MNVYISHSAKSQIGPLRDLLLREGALFRDSFDLSATREIQEKITAEIEAADAVIAVISESAPNVFFELGVALSLGKPVLLLLTPGTVVPSFLAPVTHLTSDLADSEVLRVGVNRPSALQSCGRPEKNRALFCMIESSCKTLLSRCLGCANRETLFKSNA
jgi:hypothetical protein